MKKVCIGLVAIWALSTVFAAPWSAKRGTATYSYQDTINGPLFSPPFNAQLMLAPLLCQWFVIAACIYGLAKRKKPHSEKTTQAERLPPPEAISPPRQTERSGVWSYAWLLIPALIGLGAWKLRVTNARSGYERVPEAVAHVQQATKSAVEAPKNKTQTSPSPQRGNSLVKLFREKFDDPRSDYELTLFMSKQWPEKLDQFPDFAADVERIKKERTKVIEFVRDYPFDDANPETIGDWHAITIVFTASTNALATANWNAIPKSNGVWFVEMTFLNDKSGKYFSMPYEANTKFKRVTHLLRDKERRAIYQQDISYPIFGE